MEFVIFYGSGQKTPKWCGGSTLSCSFVLKASINRLQAAQLPGSEKGLELVGKTGAIWLLRVGVPVGACGGQFTSTDDRGSTKPR